MMRNKFLLGLVGGGILLAGLVLGAVIGGGGLPAWASANAQPTPPPSQGQYCQLFMRSLASNLHVSQAQLATATQDALKTTIQQAYKDGKITQAEETKLLDRASQLGSHPCATLESAFGHHGGHAGWQGRGQLAGARQAIVSAVAAKLNLQPAALESDLASGQTLAQIAAAQHVSINDVNAAYLGAVQGQLKTAVSNGAITQQQSDRIYTMIQQAVANGHYPLLKGHAAHP
jgi:AraC-like DNA-binding protein